MGATYVEIDLRQTADGQFAVFHDDILDCKTDGKGAVSERSMDELRTLDMGYGYVTKDGDYPLRGLGVGLMPNLEEVLDRFPDRKFVLNVKDDLSSSPESLLQVIDRSVAISAHRLLIFGGDTTVRAIRELNPRLIAASRDSALRCIRDYMLLGWTGYVPGECRDTVTGMYAN